MKKIYLFSLSLLSSIYAFSQIDTNTINNLQKEAWEHSQLEVYGQELMDDIGPRLIGSPQYLKANNWLIEKYKDLGIHAYNEEYGTWKAWERGATEAHLTFPRYQQLQAIQLAWSPSTPQGKYLEAEVLILPENLDSLSFENWLKTVKNKIVLISKPEISGRPDYNWEKNAIAGDYEKHLERKRVNDSIWNTQLEKAGLNFNNLQQKLEKAGAAAVVSSSWTGAWGANRIMTTKTLKIPHLDIRLEDYQLLYRLAKRDKKPIIKIKATSKNLGEVPVHNTLAKIESPTNPEEYVMLSAHLDSWDGGTGATDNGSGTILMLEVMRILKKHYPNPKRSILVGHWGGEEQGLNGSQAFVEDHPDLMPKISVLFNQDNGTGRINWINALGFLNAYQYFQNWMDYLPKELREEIKTDFPGNPGPRASSDYASFLPDNVPAFFLISHGWDYGQYTWHTHLDTYDKLVFDDIKRNAMIIATFVYLACEEPEMFSREKAKLPINPRTGKEMEWPKERKAARDSKNYF